MPLFQSLDSVASAIAGGKPLSAELALELISLPDHQLEELVGLAHMTQQAFSGDRVDLCAIVSAKSGACEQDCAFCAQSGSASTEIDIYKMKDPSDILEHARRAEDAGAHRFCIVTSGGSLCDEDFQIALSAITLIAANTSLERCSSLGVLSRERAFALKDAGLSRYHHNLETAPSYYPNICTTQPFERRLETIAHLKDAGVECCVGGIIGLGETPAQRIEFAAQLQSVEPDSVPINFLNPREGTRLEGVTRLSSREAIRYLAIFRLMLPRSVIRLAGGRCEILGDDQELGIMAGVDGLLIGDYLTTFGPQVDRDLALLERLGFDLEKSSC